ncbi:hypothetical protein D3C72_2256830 [compost metagenome]
MSKCIIARMAIASPFKIAAFSAEITSGCSSILSKNLFADKTVVNALSQIAAKAVFEIVSSYEYVDILFLTCDPDILYCCPKISTASIVSCLP